MPKCVIKKYYMKSSEIISEIFKSAVNSSSLTYSMLAVALGLQRNSVTEWACRKLPSPKYVLKLEELLGIDFIDEVLKKTDAVYFWDRFNTVLDRVCGSKPLLERAPFLEYYLRHRGECPESYQCMSSLASYLCDIDGFPEMIDAWFAYNYVNQIKKQKLLRANVQVEKDASSLESNNPEQPPVAEVDPELCRATERNAPSTLYVCMDRVKTYAEDQGVSLTSENLELYTNMAASYIYQFFFGAKFDSVPRNFPMSEDDKGPYYYVEDHIFHSIKKLEDFDFAGYLKRHNVTVVLTFDQANDSITKRLKS